MDKIGKNVDANTGEATEKFNTMANEIGLNYKDESNQVYTNAELFWRAIDALHNRYSMGLLNDAQLEEYSQEFFGRGFRDLLPLIEKGSGAWQEYADSAQVMSTAQVEAMGAFDDARQELEASLDITKYELLASLAPTFTEVAQSLASVVQSFNEFLTTEEGQQMLQSLSDAVSGLVKSFTTDNFNSLVETAATWMERLTDALNWLADPANEGKINGALTTIGASLAGLHISKDVLTALMFFRVGKAALFGGGGAKVLGANAANAANAGANASAGADVANNATNGGLMYWINRGLNRVFGDPSAFLSSTGTTIAPLSLLMPDYEDIWRDPDEYVRRSWEEHQELLQSFRDEEAARKAEELALAATNALFDADAIAANKAEEAKAAADAAGVIDLGQYLTLPPSTMPPTAPTGQLYAAGAAGAVAALDHLPSAFGAGHYSAKAGEIAEGLFNEILSGDAARHAAEEATAEVVDIYDNAGRKAAHAAGRAVVEAATGDTGGTASTVNVSDAAMATQVLNNLTRWGRSIDQAQFDNLSNMFSGTGNTAYYDQFSGIFGSDFFERYGLGGGPGAMQSGFAQMAADIQSAMSGVGTDAATGLKDGIEAGVPDATTAGADLANGAVEGATTALDAHSPSRVMFDLGQNAAIGLANGIDAQLATVQAAAQRLANIVRDVVTTSLMIHSPSQVMAGLGAFTAEGFAEGISASVWRVEDAMDRMIGATQRVPVYRGAGASGGAAEGGDIHAYIVMDKEIVGELVAPTVDGVIGATISARR